MGEMNRDQWAAMSDDEILAHYRRRHTYCDLAWAKARHREALRWWHLRDMVKQRADRERQAEQERIRRKLFGEPAL